MVYGWVMFYGTPWQNSHMFDLEKVDGYLKFLKHAKWKL